VKVVLIAGARPNFMKIAPIQRSLDRRKVSNVLVHTGQHYDASMSEVFFEELGIRSPDHHLDVGSGSHAVQTARVMETLEPVLIEEAPDWVVVVGDVNSTMASAIVASKLGIGVAHVEAGLRSGDWDMPEEINRVVTDHVSDLLLAPSSDAVDNLRSEGVGDLHIALVGNVMVDTLLSNLERAVAGDVLRDLGLEACGYGLVTLHRPSNVDEPRVLGSLINTLDEIAENLPLVWPVHPRVRDALARRGGPRRVRLIEPVGYLDSIALQAAARVVFTDSGGVQEETTVLGTACLTLRTTTERPITVEQGTNQVVGIEHDDIVAGLAKALDGGVVGRRPDLWDGATAERIVDALLQGKPAR
jgi:UDP-N-acetylglucosamine 2-epimerase (non-hydrolysing)